MAKATFLIIIGIILAIISIIALCKNIIFKYKLGDRGFKAVITALLILFALFGAALTISSGYDIRSVTYQLADPQLLEPEELAELKEELVIRWNIIYTSIILGYIALIGHYLLYRNIQGKIDEKYQEVKKTRWDMSKLNK